MYATDHLDMDLDIYIYILYNTSPRFPIAVGCPGPMLHPVQLHQVSGIYKRIPRSLGFSFDASPRRTSGGGSRAAHGGCCPRRARDDGSPRGAHSGGSLRGSMAAAPRGTRAMTDPEGRATTAVVPEARRRLLLHEARAAMAPQGLRSGSGSHGGRAATPPS